MGIWVVGTALSMPNLLFFTTFAHEFSDGGTRVVCYAEWPDGPSIESYQEYM
jgi:tachykinin-like receptor